MGQKRPEHVRQAWIHRFLNAVVLEPREIRGIDQAGKHQAAIGTRMAIIGRGCAPGTPDHWVFQGNPFTVLAIEIKHETSGTGPQQATARSLRRCGVFVLEDCRTIAQVADALEQAGIRVSHSMRLIIPVYQEQMDAGLRELAGGKKKPARSGPPRVRTSARKAQAWGVQRRATLP